MFQPPLPPFPVESIFPNLSEVSFAMLPLGQVAAKNKTKLTQNHERLQRNKKKKLIILGIQLLLTQFSSGLAKER